MAAIVLAVLVIVAGGIVVGLKVAGDGSITNGIDRVAESTGSLNDDLDDVLVAACNGTGDPRFDAYDPAAPPTTDVPLGTLPPTAGHGVMLVYSSLVGPLTAAGIHSTPRTIEPSVSPNDPAKVQLLACVLQITDARPVGTCTTGFESYEATFQLSLRAARTGAEVFATKFVDGDGCAIFRHLDPVTESVTFHVSSAYGPVKPYVLGAG